MRQGPSNYNVYINPNGCDGNNNNFSFVNRFLAPGFTDGGAPPATATGPYPNGANKTLVNGALGWPCPVATVSICAVAYNNLSPTALCFAQARSQLCQPPDSELAAQCFSGCPPPPGLLSQENAPMQLQYPRTRVATWRMRTTAWSRRIRARPMLHARLPRSRRGPFSSTCPPARA